MKKKILPMMSSLFLCTLVACSESEDTAATSSATVTKIVATNFNTTVSPFTPNDSTTYNLNSQERIVATERRWTNNSNLGTSEYQYTNGKLTQINGYQNGVYTSRTVLVYNNDDLIEYRIEGITNNNITKHTFVVSQDTIYSEWQRSTNGGSSYNTLLSSKIVLENGNRTFYESFDPINNERKRILTTFDANHNPLVEIQYLYSQSVVWTPVLTNSLTYSTLKSPFYKALESTFGRRSLGLLQHLSSNAINFINLRNLAPNCVATYTTDFGGAGTVNFDIINTAFNTEYAKRSVINSTSGPITTSLAYNFYF